MSPATFESYAAVADSGLVARVLEHVISRGGRSKKYTDLIPLDGGTVGIAHFATGGLAKLYERMDTVKYFGRSREEMIHNYSTACRPEGKEGNDTGWGCYSQGWWRAGMQAFLESPESRSVQDAAWGAMMRPVIEDALAHGWKSDGRSPLRSVSRTRSAQPGSRDLLRVPTGIRKVH